MKLPMKKSLIFDVCENQLARLPTGSNKLRSRGKPIHGLHGLFKGIRLLQCCSTQIYAHAWKRINGWMTGLAFSGQKGNLKFL